MRNASIRTPGGLALSALVLLLAMFACGGPDTRAAAGDTEPRDETAVAADPSEPRGADAMNLVGGTAEASDVEEAPPNSSDRPSSGSAQAECNLAETPYDTVAIASTPENVVRMEVRDSGPDRHILTTITDDSGVVVNKSEAIKKDGTRYSRESAPGNPEAYGAWSVVGTDLPPSFPPPCLDPGSIKEDASGSSDEPHFTTERFLSVEEGSVRDEYWADAAGRPIRSRRTFFPPGYDGVSNTETGVMEFTYFGYGEPNIITAPCAGAAPDQAENPALMRDCINLLAIKDALRGTATLNWALDTAIASWAGVTASGTPVQIVKVQMPNQGLTGSVPAGLWHLSALTHLDLSDNSLTGEIPRSLDNLSNLADLRLSGNALTGCIPIVLHGIDTNDLGALNLPDC